MEAKQEGNEPQVKQYVEFYYPGIFMSETNTKEVATRCVAELEIPDECFGFCFFEKQEIVFEGEKLVGKPRNHSGIFYPGGVLYSVGELMAKNQNGKYDILISNMKCNKWDLVVETRKGNFQPFYEDKDVIL
jgi:hypothetical protein